MECHWRNCRNMLKEEIKANEVYGREINQIVPVNRVIKVGQYNDRNRRNAGADQQFADLFMKERNRVRDKGAEKKEESLRRMEGQNQYNCQAVEIFFLLSRNMDYKA